MLENSAPPKEQISQSGHRERLLNRFVKAGAKGLHDYEIMELLLTFILPRKDTKSLAKKLLERYKTINGCIHAPLDQLEEFSGLGARSAAFFQLVREMFAYCLQERYQQKPIISHRGDVETYLRFYFGGKQTEYVAVLFLDTGNRVIESEILFEGTVNQCAVYPRDIVLRGLRLRAASFILAHNHPGGTQHASEPDWLLTERLITIGRLLDMPLIDHIIISQDTAISLRESSRWPT